tara:strand:- start:152 stop:1681 length:1530 start_codon:yes stop_codon:yes gene_type:complete
MPVSSNRRQRVINFATPKVADLVIIEVVDASKNINSADAADNTAYGTAHPNAAKFPYFKLAHIKNADDDQGQFQYWYYVKDRDKQDEYNWEYQAAGANNPHYDTVVRTYVTPRPLDGVAGGFDNVDDPEITSPMPVTLSDPFEEDDDYILFEKKQTRSGDEFLDSLYVVEQHVYVKRVPMWRVDVDPEFADYDVLISKETLWYIGETPTATRKFDEDPDEDTGLETAALFADGVAEIDVHADFVAEEGTIGGEISTTTNFWGVDQHGILREGKQLTDNWYAIIEKQVVGKVGLLSTVYTYQSYSWPAVLDGCPSEGGVATDDEQAAIGDGEESTIAGAEGDNTGGILMHTWTRRKGGGDSVATPIFKRNAWSGPTKVKIERFWRNTVWQMGAGTVDEEGVAQATDGTDDLLAHIVPMLPEPINFVTPIATVRVGPSLHQRIHLYATTGTNHPTWVYAGSSFTFDRTNYVDWPVSLVVSDTQTAHRGGYLRERVTAFSPRVENVGASSCL